ncbi:GAF domain-containing protein [Propionivibrio dicarboxylicus]|uniref:GAF domain-containing protein n=1 Tax=Propionivibrio dicarboxylicus TaxID=83767 RepID=A0A1G7ZHA8_9RHOO|nr:GAF domain-containing protein [Propionivibrio dicarboxylicus]SDH07995.1 GAF domain-containing protein [Propionivibrio dicarboxylicus]
MERIDHFVTWRPGLTWSCAVASIIMATGLAALIGRDYWQNNRLSQLETSVERVGNTIMSQTISGTLMGAISLTGLTNDEIKSDGMSRTMPNTPKINRLFETICAAFDAEGVFVGDADAIIRASWNRNDAPVTGVNFTYRPYFHVAMQGTENVYAAVGTTMNQRTLYFAAPVFAQPTKTTPPIGVIIARTSLNRIDRILAGIPHIAVLISPQGVIFAANRQGWFGQIIGTLSPERLKAIRNFKQFGKLFEISEPTPLMLPTTHGIHSFEGKEYAVASTPIHWNDPLGDWSLVFMESLEETVSKQSILTAALLSGAITATIALLLITLLRSHYRQREASEKIRNYAQIQEAHARQKEVIATLSLQLQQSDNTEALARTFLSGAHTLLGILQGVLYAKDAGGKLQLVASYACETQPPARLDIGEGLVGQCALQQSRIMLEATDDVHWQIHSGLGEAPPSCVVICPIELNKNLVGVLEMALPERPSDDQEICIETMLPMLAMNLEIKIRHEAAYVSKQNEPHLTEDSA